MSNDEPSLQNLCKLLLVFVMHGLKYARSDVNAARALWKHVELSENLAFLNSQVAAIG